MTVRKRLNQNPKAVAGVVGGFIFLILVFVLFSQGSNPPGTQTREFFSDDDGKTAFVGDIEQLPPFDHGGKTAVRARLFTTDGGKTRFIGYLERYTLDARKALEDAKAAAVAGKRPTVSPSTPQITVDGTEVKRPGDAKWVQPKDMAGRTRVTAIVPPAGQVLDAVTP